MARKSKQNGTNVTLKEVAKALGLSTMTISRVVNDRPNVDEQTRQKVLEKAREMGYTPNHVAKSLVSSKTYTIGVIIPEITHAFFPEVVRGIEEETYDKKYQLFLVNAAESYEREKNAILSLRSKRVDGLLVSSCQADPDYAFYKQVIDSGMPFVFFDRCIEGIGASCVSVDDEAGAMRAVEHLIGYGYRNIVHLCGPKDVSVGQKRLNGYLTAMKKHGLEVKQDWIADSGFQESGGYQAMKEMLDLPEGERPRAVFAVNDPVAIGAMDAIREKGLSIPDDIAIVGFTDDVRAGLIATPLTTMHQPAYEVGKKAARKLIHTIENREEPVEHLEVKTRLVVRASCGAKN
ncbi:LacI family DNA-binding transcriptional regulator [Balneolaceae bacterium ANBcel3]|nr:LacI family DNA-binding transcriptional regulator [Balneolaceae bacterium ANBcel3]